MVNELFNELDGKLSELDEKIKRLSQPVQNTQTDGRQKGLGLGLGLGMRLVSDLTAGLVVGMGLGLLAEKFFKTGGLVLAAFILLGAAAGFLNLYRTVQQLDRKG